MARGESAVGSLIAQMIKMVVRKMTASEIVMMHRQLSAYTPLSCHMSRSGGRKRIG